MSVRLVTRREVTGWQDDVRAALGQAQERQKHAMTVVLKSHGLTWDSAARSTSVDLWAKDSWADAVRRDVEPVVRAVAKHVTATIKGRVSKRRSLGFDPEDQLVALVLDKVLAMEPKLTIQAVTAAASETRFGGVTHPEANPTILDEYQARFAELDRLTERITGHMSDAAQQVLAEGAVASAGVKYVWTAVGDERTRPEHMDADGQVQNAGDAFDVGGEELQYPGDPDGSDENVDNCRCVTGDCWVDPSRAVAVLRRPYIGDLVTITTASGHKLAATPNHPVLTPRGWRALGSLDEGDNIVSGALGQRASRRDPNERNAPVQIEKLFEAAAVSNLPQRMALIPMDFYGDAPEGEVEVAVLHDHLTVDLEATRRQSRREVFFAGSHRQVRLARDSATLVGVGEPLAVGGTAIAYSGAGVANDPGDGVAVDSEAHGDGLDGLPALVGSHHGSFIERQTSASGGDGVGLLVAERVEQASPAKLRTPHAVPAMSEVARVLGADTGNVQLDRVLDTRRASFRGWVYDLSTTCGWFHADGIILHNCWLEVDGDLEVDDDYQVATEIDAEAPVDWAPPEVAATAEDVLERWQNNPSSTSDEVASLIEREGVPSPEVSRGMVMSGTPEEIAARFEGKVTLPPSSFTGLDAVADEFAQLDSRLPEGQTSVKMWTEGAPSVPILNAADSSFSWEREWVVAGDFTGRTEIDEGVVVVTLVPR